MPGSWLPSERALAQEFGVDRYVVPNASARLEQQGLIVREPGRRPWVSHQPPPEAADKHSGGRSSRTVAAVLPQHVGDHASREMLLRDEPGLRSQETRYRLLIFRHRP